MTVAFTNPHSLPKAQMRAVGFMPLRVILPTFSLPLVRRFRECVGDTLLVQPTVQGEGAV